MKSQTRITLRFIKDLRVVHQIDKVLELMTEEHTLDEALEKHLMYYNEFDQGADMINVRLKGRLKERIKPLNDMDYNYQPITRF